jgi:hypothetical protein
MDLGEVRWGDGRNVAGTGLCEENEFFLSVYLILPTALGPRVYSASNKNEYQKQENNISGDQSAAGAYG